MTRCSAAAFGSLKHVDDTWHTFILFIYSLFLSFFVQTTPEEVKTEKKSDQPPQAKKPKVKTKVLELPIENSPQWQLAEDMLNLFVENEVKAAVFTLIPQLRVCACGVLTPLCRASPG